MICRQCGTQIADKAIVCYRCGTATTEPLRKPAEIRQRRSPVWALIIVLLAILIALLLARNYQLFGVSVVTLDDLQALGILIDFPLGNA